MRWRSRRRRTTTPSSPDPARSWEPEARPAPSGGDGSGTGAASPPADDPDQRRDAVGVTDEATLPPPAVQLPPPPVRVVPGEDPTDSPDEASDPVGPADDPAHDAQEWADALAEARAAHDQPTPTRHAAPAPLPGDATLPREAVAAAGRAVVRRALDEDLDVAGDVTAQATVAVEAEGLARLVARAEGVVAGLDLVTVVYDHLDPRVRVRPVAADGEHVRAGQVVAEIAGPLRSVLTGERTALNLLTHLSGVATVTARYVAAVADTGCVVRDTRKTTPGLRLLEKAAVHAGGGVNHRLGLSDALLVKDNHVAAAGGVGPATRAALAHARGRHVQVEVDSLEELEVAVGAGARDLLLDNFDVAATERAVARVRELEASHGRILLESSGGLDLEAVRERARAGVDRVAVGALTHSAPQLDLALDLEPVHLDAGA